MKTVLILAFEIVFLFFVACQSDEPADVNPELPAWLEERIQEDESIINSDSTLLPNYGAWIRHQYQGSYYFEYDNPLSSVFLEVYTLEGKLTGWSHAEFTAYLDKRCCETYLWKASKYMKLE
ncbi:MAG: hypothetical protein ACFB15_10345 [Cyclobacteriaceae bacterium]